MARQRGFILVFTLWILVAVAATLAIIGLRGKGGSSVSEKELQELVESRQALSVLDYVLRHAAEFDVQLDPRLVAYEKVMQERAAQIAASDDRLAVLRELLAAMNFNLRLDDPRSKTPEEKPKGDGKGAAGAKGDQPNAVKRKSSVKYAPRPEPYAIAVADTTFTARILPGNALPNLNFIGALALERSLVDLGLPKAEARRLAAVVADWVDADSMTAEGGAEAAYAASGRRAYVPRNGPIQSWAELAYLKDMSPDVLRLLRDNFTLFGNDPRVLPDYVPEKTIAALADMPVGRTRVALQLLQSPETIRPDVPILTEAEMAAITRTVTRAPDERLIIVQIKGPATRITAWYDTQQRRVLDWHLD